MAWIQGPAADCYYRRPAEQLFVTQLRGEILQGDILCKETYSVRTHTMLRLGADIPSFDIRGLRGFGFTRQPVEMSIQDLNL